MDSAGQTRALDLLLQLGESFRDNEGLWQDLRESSRDTLARAQEIGASLLLILRTGCWIGKAEPLEVPTVYRVSDSRPGRLGGLR